MLLDFVNIEHNKDFDYLEATITDNLAEQLKTRFVYDEIPKVIWEKTRDTHGLYRDDHYTKTFGMSLGEHTQAEIVIAGGFRIIDGRGRAAQIAVQVVILDVTNGKVVSEFTDRGPADANIFGTIDKIVSRIVKEASVVLPDKDAFARGGGRSGRALRVFRGFSISLLGGGGMLQLGYGNRIEMIQPALRLEASSGFPLLSDRVDIHLGLTGFIQQPIAGKNPDIEGLNIRTSNLNIDLALSYPFDLTSKLTLRPKIGGGTLLQSTTVTGVRNGNFTNATPTGILGLQFDYSMASNVALIFSAHSLAIYETNTVTLAHIGAAGVKLNL